MSETKLNYEYYSSVKKKKIDWLWYPYIPYGKLTILQGDPGDGKSTFMINIAALLTKGYPMPDGYKIDKPQTVVYQCAEDNVADTIKPRLLSAKADCNKVAYIIDNDCSLSLADGRIENTIAETGAKLFILDPIQAFLAQDMDMHSAVKMRTTLRKLANIAMKYNCAVVLIGHMSKAGSDKKLYRGLGSIDIAAIARSVLMISRDSTNTSVRYMYPIKSSLAPEGPAIGFQFDDKNRIQWIGNFNISEISDNSNSLNDKGKIGQAARLLYDILEDNDVLSTELLNKLKLMGLSSRTVQSAKKQLKITSYKRDGVWYWHLPKI